MISKLSVLMPCYNAEPFQLRTAIESIANQTYENIELVIADDASTRASTVETLQKAAERYPDKVRVIRRSENGGTARAQESALNEANEDTIYFSVLGADDFCHRTCQERRVKMLERLPDSVAIVYDNYMMLSDFVLNFQSWSPEYDQYGKPILRPQAIPITLRPYDYRALLESNYIPGVSMWRASIYEKLPKGFIFDGYDTVCGRHGEDYAHWLAITDHFDAFWINCDPAFSWTYRFKLNAKSGDRKGVEKARRFIQQRAKERRGLT